MRPTNLHSNTITSDLTLKPRFGLQEFHGLVAEIENWKESVRAEDARDYADRVNRQYDQFANRTSAEHLVELRLMRSLWAKQVLEVLLKNANERIETANTLDSFLELVKAIRGYIPSHGVSELTRLQQRVGDHQTAMKLAWLLADYSSCELGRASVPLLDPTGKAGVRQGPSPIARFRPIKKSGRSFSPNAWFEDPRMSALEFVDGNPDRVRIRGIELHSGDIGIVQLNHPGDGIVECFLEKPGLAPHVMLYVTRRVRSRSENRVLYQPSLVEIYEGGWRCIPLTTGLSPNFSWYSEWVRPTGLPSDVGELLSRQIDQMKTVAFDFQGRRIPTGGIFDRSWGAPSASCTNFIRIPFELAKLPSLPYPVTRVHPIAFENLQRIGLPLAEEVHTPTNILNDSGYQKIGLVDNGVPEMAFAQALVVGRPDQIGTFGGMLCQRQLLPEKLPDWHNISHWKSAWESLKICMGQNEGFLGSTARMTFGYTQAEIPSANPTVIAFYVRSDQEAGWIVNQTAYPKLLKWFSDGGTTRLSQLRSSTFFDQNIRGAIQNCALEREGWYAPATGV